YAEAPDQQREVVYYDKARMEVTHPDGDPSQLWYVTNGLLVVELMTGNLQTGNAAFEQRAPAEVNVAGDPGSGPTYADLAPLRLAAPLADDATITQRIDADGQ